MKKILCPVDLRADTLNALEAAAKVALAHHAQLVLLHVFTKSEYQEALTAAEGDLDRVAETEQDIQLSMNRLCGTLQESMPGLNCVTVMRQGSIVSSILEEARVSRANLIVMGSHGVSSITEAMDGNHPVKVIEGSPCPVLCVPNEVSFELPAKVVYGSRMKREDPDCLQRLLALLHPFGSRIEVVYVGEDSATVKQKWVEHERLIRSYVPYDKMRFHLFPWKKDTYLGIDEFQRQADGKLLVLLTHQRNYLQRLFEKSVFKQFTYYSDFPVLVFLDDHLASAKDTEQSNLT